MAILRNSVTVGAVGSAGTGAAPASPLLPRPAVSRSLVFPSNVVETIVPLMKSGRTFGSPGLSPPLLLQPATTSAAAMDAMRLDIWFSPLGVGGLRPVL